MCFWFGIEILRQVYEKCFFKYCKVSILFDLLSSEKKFLQNSPQRISKEAGFCADFKNVQKSWV